MTATDDDDWRADLFEECASDPVVEPETVLRDCSVVDHDAMIAAGARRMAYLTRCIPAPSWADANYRKRQAMKRRKRRAEQRRREREATPPPEPPRLIRNRVALNVVAAFVALQTHPRPAHESIRAWPVEFTGYTIYFCPLCGRQTPPTPSCQVYRCDGHSFWVVPRMATIFDHQ